MFKSTVKKKKLNLKKILIAIGLSCVLLTLTQIKLWRGFSSLNSVGYDESQDFQPPNPSSSIQSKGNITYSKEKRYMFHRPELDIFYDKTEQSRLTDKNKVKWENLVFMMLTHNDPEANSLIHAQFETWVKRVGNGVDIVIVTDIDDPRSDQEILPSNYNMSWINVDIYRSDTPNEGRKGRSKVIDGFLYVHKKYKNNAQKSYIMKVDPDNYLLPHALLKFLKTLYERTYPQPVDFGKSNCNNDFVCYSQGGLYGWDRGGFERIFNYMTEHKDKIYDEIYYNRWNPGRNILQSEDVFTSYVFRKATGYPAIFNRGIGANLTEIIHFKQMPKDLVSIHPIKKIDDFHKLEDIFYDSVKNIQKGRNGAMQALIKKSHSLDASKLIWDAQKMEFRQK